MRIMKLRALLYALSTVMPCVSYAMTLPPLVCPTSLEPSSIKIEGVENGWTPFVKAPMYLSGAAPIYGPPDTLGDLVPDGERRGKGTVSTVYDLDGFFKEGKWMQCFYGEYSQLTLSRRMPDATKTCTITYRKGEKAGQNKITIACR